MALGDLSADQVRYVDLVTAETGLARPVVVSWVGAESGWGTNKAGHNYLNVGPGRTYPTVEQAAANAAALVTNSDHYVGIRAAIPAGGGAQIQAIGASPWGTTPATLTAVYSGLTGGPAAKNVSLIGDAAGAVGGALGDAAAGAVGGLLGGAGKAVGGAVGDAAGSVGSAVTDGVASAFKSLLPLALEVGLGLVFTVAAFAFIAMGVNRLTGAPPKGIFQTVSGAVGTAAGAAKLAAL